MTTATERAQVQRVRDDIGKFAVAMAVMAIELGCRAVWDINESLKQAESEGKCRNHKREFELANGIHYCADILTPLFVGTKGENSAMYNTLVALAPKIVKVRNEREVFALFVQTYKEVFGSVEPA